MSSEAVSPVEALERIERYGLVPVVEIGRVEQAPPLLEALAGGGLPVAEITLRTDAGLRALAAARESHPSALVGAGTVRNPSDARRAIDAGAQFVVSPGTNLAVVEMCRTAGVLALPGVCTPSEVETAVGAGVGAMKFFPAGPMGGVAFLKALAGPFGEVRFVPTGGVNPENLRDYLRLKNVIACGGSWLVAPVLLADERFEEIESLTRAAVRIVEEVRENG